MDVAIGTTNVPLSGRTLTFTKLLAVECVLLITLLLHLIFPANSFAQGQEPLHASGDREVWNRRENRVELIGHAAVRRPGESLTADYIIMDQNLRTIDAFGNCVYIASDTVIYGEEMHFNLDSRTGTIVAGRVSNENFSLAGQRINKLGEGRFQTHWGEYTTCRDCAPSWSFQAQDVDMQIEGYAYLSNVALKVKDAPSAWLPYLIVPMKTKRQSGLLFPALSASATNGFTFVLPYFWAINRSSDMTFGVGSYTKRGARLEWEGRYAFSDRSVANADFFYINDKSFADMNVAGNAQINPTAARARWALDLSQTQELPFRIDEKLRITEVSDNLYPFYIGDISVQKEMVLSSTLSLSHTSSDFSAYFALQRYRNLLAEIESSQNGVRSFDPNTVQVLPSAVVTTNDRYLLGTPVAAGLTFGVSNFTRSAGPFDVDIFSISPDPGTFRPGIDPIREATRVSIVPSLYTTLRPWDILSFTPSLKYFSYFYSFHNVLDNWYRSHVLFQADLSAQLEKIYSTDNPERPRKKHLVRPLLTYSYIPESLIHQDAHPFLSQIEYARSNEAYGYNFDSNDIIPLDSPPGVESVYFLPLGNSLAYGLTTQLIERVGKEEATDPSYRMPLEFTAGQAINFREYRTGEPKPFTRLFSNLNFSVDDRLVSTTTYYYYPYQPLFRHWLSTSASYIFERATRQRVLLYDRSVSLTYALDRVTCTERTTDGKPCGNGNIIGSLNFSLNDYILPTFSISYNSVKDLFNSFGMNLTFQSPSRCWKFVLTQNYQPTTGPVWGVDFALNLTGSGFGGVTEAYTGVTAPK